MLSKTDLSFLYSAPGSNCCIGSQTLHCTALHFTALHCTPLHCTALHCTALGAGGGAGSPLPDSQHSGRRLPSCPKGGRQTGSGSGSGGRLLHYPSVTNYLVDWKNSISAFINKFSPKCPTGQLDLNIERL
jgi:hypothetical protein